MALRGALVVVPQLAQVDHRTGGSAAALLARALGTRSPVPTRPGGISGSIYPACYLRPDHISGLMVAHSSSQFRILKYRGRRAWLRCTLIMPDGRIKKAGVTGEFYENYKTKTSEEAEILHSFLHCVAFPPHCALRETTD